MALQDIMLRLGLAILAGGVIGAEREAMRRPAGLRTHMLVAGGAALVMLLGEYVFEMYEGRADVDPTRLGAQVISGIGFLGAGTIMREGLTIRGLTTAASLWAVACLGLAAGAGFYAGTLLGTGIILLTLYALERLQNRVLDSRSVLFLFHIGCGDAAQALTDISRLAAKYNAAMEDFSSDRAGEGYQLTFKLRFPPPHRPKGPQTGLLADIAALPGVSHVGSERL